MNSKKYRERLIQARERKGWSIHEAATQVAANSILNRASYYDIELCDGDLTSCCSLYQIIGICKILDVHPSDIFCNETHSPVSIPDVMDKIKTHCAEKKVPISEFENITGWRVESCLNSPINAFQDWNIECLADICSELKFNWRCVVASL